VTSPVNDDTRLVAYALRHPRGRYVADRASQLSGVPKSTLYDWRREKVFVPDFTGASPTNWSYRDLVLLRLLAWLRQIGMPRPKAAKHVATIKTQATSGVEIRHLWATAETLLINDEREDRLGGPSVLPFADLRGLVATFDLLDPVKELRNPGHERYRLWAPDLVTPSEYTFISPWVLAGDPCIANSRVPSAAVYALHEERGLTSEALVELYPGVTVEAAQDAYILEQRLRGRELPEPLAA
jgi:uncharacterized protein (DUF433 family)